MQHETIYVGDKKVSIRTTLLEEKATAVNMLCCYADELKEGFYPYVAQVIASCSYDFSERLDSVLIFLQLSKFRSAMSDSQTSMLYDLLLIIVLKFAGLQYCCPLASLLLP